jgi:hypothetical protein
MRSSGRIGANSDRGAAHNLGCGWIGNFKLFAFLDAPFGNDHCEK